MSVAINGSARYHGLAVHDRRAYRLDAKPVARGGQAEVLLGERKSDGLPIAFKRRSSGMAKAKARMRREIEVQSTLRHPHVMPILDWDDVDHGWYVMPRGTRSLGDLSTPLDDAELTVVLRAMLEALRFAHASDIPHRDVKPSNVIEIADGDGATRWVLADWGLTRRARGETTTDLTETGAFLGTEGYAPPEAYVDAHAIGPAGDLYSVGQVIGWAKTGKDPIPNVVAAAPEPWRRIARMLTQLAERDRLPSAEAVLAMLPTSGIPVPTGDIAALLDRARAGDADAALAACVQALDHEDDHDLFLDEIATLDTVADALVARYPDETRRLVRAMIGAFDSFGRRDFNYANVPLGWMHGIARAAASAEKLDVLEDVCDTLFPFEAGWNRFVQRDRTVAWLRALHDPAARVVAACLRSHGGMRSYLGGRIDGAASAAIRDAMREPRK